MVATAARPNQVVQEPEQFEQLISRRRRRPGWILAGISMVVLSMLIGVLLFTWTATTQKMLAVDEEIVAGHIMTSEDLRVVDVNPDASFAWIRADQQDKIIGRAAKGNMPEGTLISEGLFTEPSLALVEGKVNIPYAADVSQLPFTLDDGSPVRMYSVVGDSNDGQQAGAASIGTARVVSIAQVEGTPQRLVSLLVDADTEAQVLQAIADNKLRLVLIGS